MPSQINRRDFLQRSALSLAGLYLVEGTSRAARVSPNEKLNIGLIGIAGMGGAHVEGCRPENVVALCDIDDDNLAAVAKQFPRARLYRDFRKLLEQKDIDAVSIATPDHVHAPATLWAMESGRHVYCEKPLTHNIYEARKVTETARRLKRVTQMGIQIHSNDNYRRVVEIVQSGAIGPVHEVHCWSGTVWSGGRGRPVGTPPVPATTHWKEWLGPALDRPYHPAYVPKSWRGFWEFGGGGLADMACHHMDLPFWALGLRHPLTVESEGPEVDAECAPEWTIATYTFGARGKQPPLTFKWYNGPKQPRYFDEGILPPWAGGTLFVGAKGYLMANYGAWKLWPEKDFEGYEPPKPTIPSSPGHHAEWIRAIKTGSLPTCHFDYSGPLTETVLLGNVAYRTGEKLNWDAHHCRVTNVERANVLLKRVYREGWEL